MNNRIRLFLLNRIPKKLVSRLVGRFAESSLSKWLIPLYARHFQVDLQQAEKPIHEYRSLTEFFTRKLKPGCRPLASGNHVIISPVDGVISQFGTIEDGTLIQAKGVSYSLVQLIGNKEKASVFEGGLFLTIYLSPKDYHRIHTCLTGTITGYSYMPGTLFPVNPFGVRNVPGLFAKNERLTTYFETPYGEYAIVKVGATIVGSIKVVYDPDLTTNQPRGVMTQQKVTGPQLQKGEEMGLFRFGSTVILLFQPGMAVWEDLQEGQFVQMGQRIGFLQTDREFVR
ncbi:archaetidylserine decarboxylase [Effusibacillus dendaii]|uniref:Phosphatidylserine decarboxylase proenzyme n=1 Tax=Effusibacillus dendaii TaxID=2743772 RepID=A0A7I8DBF9_9BACL|nr:archaetidylserine decarboxylase [Effusibacillus dendaii]BCJ87425.1 phosphatidylserine decarboxylase proenzyme [Effusibacillus dendaii]